MKAKISRRASQLQGVYIVELEFEPSKMKGFTQMTVEEQRRIARNAISSFIKRMKKIKASNPDMKVSQRESSLLPIAVVAGRKGLSKQIRSLPGVKRVVFSLTAPQRTP